jgi:hypothetical protein
MKTCSKCGAQLDESMFYVNNANKDHLDTFCKECRKKMNNENRKRKAQRDGVAVESNNLIKVYSNPDLAQFTPRQLMQELKARGFKWEYMLEPQRKVMFDKI